MPHIAGTSSYVGRELVLGAAQVIESTIGSIGHGSTPETLVRNPFAGSETNTSSAGIVLRDVVAAARDVTNALGMKKSTAGTAIHDAHRAAQRASAAATGVRVDAVHASSDLTRALNRARVAAAQLRSAASSIEPGRSVDANGVDSARKYDALKYAHDSSVRQSQRVGTTGAPSAASVVRLPKGWPWPETYPHEAELAMLARSVRVGNHLGYNICHPTLYSNIETAYHAMIALGRTRILTATEKQFVKDCATVLGIKDPVVPKPAPTAAHPRMTSGGPAASHHHREAAQAHAVRGARHALTTAPHGAAPITVSMPTVNVPMGQRAHVRR